MKAKQSTVNPPTAAMSSTSLSLYEHKQRLMTALGPQHQATYLQHLKLWFRQKWTKEEFDRESRKLLGAASLRLHNQFFVALLNKVDPLNQQQQQRPAHQHHQHPLSISTTVGNVVTTTTIRTTQTGTSTAAAAAASASGGSVQQQSLQPSAAKRRKRSSRPAGGSDRGHHFDMADLFEYIADAPPAGGSGGTPPRSLSPQRFAAQELFLPDATLIMGRLLIGAWEAGLQAADDAVAEMLVLAVQVCVRRCDDCEYNINTLSSNFPTQNLLKNILTAVLLRRKHCRLSGTHGHFAYDIGRPLADPSLRTTLSRRAAPVDDAPHDIDLALGVSSVGAGLPAYLQTLHQQQLMLLQQQKQINVINACEQLEERRPARRISVLDVYRTLSGERGLVPAHSVLAPNVERMSQMLH